MNKKNTNHSTSTNGVPVISDTQSLTVGKDGPIVLHDTYLIDQLAHFNREKVVERQPHAKGSGAFGIFKTTENISQYTKASLFQSDKETEVLLRFSTVAGESGSPDTWRDVRGFSLKFYTDEGNYDLVGNNTPVFFVRDPIKFPHFIRSQKRLADSGLRDNDMQWDFWTSNPETAHQVTYLMGDRGLPKSWRLMNGYGSHTYMWINNNKERFWVKYHFKSNQGVENFNNEEADIISGKDADFHRRDLFEAIKKGNFPSWTLYIQVMPYQEAKTYSINPFDLTKVWPHKDYPLIKVGTLTLNKNPENFFAQIEQAAFSPANVVPGIGLSPDRMLLARSFAYSDAQRSRIGTNFHQLPVNHPKTKINNYLIDGNMTFEHNGNAATYLGNSYNKPWSDHEGIAEDGWETDGELIRSTYTLREKDDDFSQAGDLVRRVFSDDEKERLINQVVASLSGVSEAVRLKVFDYWKKIDLDTGNSIEKKFDSL